MTRNAATPRFGSGEGLEKNPLLPGTFKHNLEAFKTELGKAKVNKDFYPLIPLSLARQLIQNSYAGVLGAHAFIRLPDLLELLDAQYNNENPMEPGDNPGRWAVVNAVVALSVRFKTAAGAELEFSPVAMSGYHNATMVVHSLILQAPSLLTIQALLAMALFARGIPDQQAFVMLATNASSQFEIWRRLRWKGEAMAMMLNMEETVADALVGSVAARLLEEANSFMV
ncbi:hypothetical protein F5Y16DRAFT_405120 [Xylariaceae sp. FL0255]|nr:hypothetical protein F5Y16DRAFT_405120 [Xylariaceae sp. FL0255]